MMPSRSLPVFGLLIVLVGCASSVPVSTQPEADSWNSSVGSVEAEAADIVCDRDAVLLSTRAVRAHVDGVRVVVRNPGGAWGFDLHPLSYEYGSAMGDVLRDAPADETWPLPPGDVTVACLPNAHSSYFDPEARTATFRVVDPDGLYVPEELACGLGEQYRIRIDTAEGEEPATVFRRVPGVLPTDELRKPAYPRTRLIWPTFIVFREGEAVARISGPRMGEVWKLFIDACPGSGFQNS